MVDSGQIAFRNRSVEQSRFAMIPRADIPRSVFVTEFTHKTTFDAGRLVPIYLEEVLPGDTFNVTFTGFARMGTPVFPVMDNFHLESFFFFVPNRLVWTNWVKMMGERLSPADHNNYSVPQVVFSAAVPVGSVADYMGIPGQTGQYVEPFEVNALPFRGYELIWNEWFRDENLQTPIAVNLNDTDEQHTTSIGFQQCLRRGKRPDYFTTALPWPQKGDAVTLPLGTTAPVNATGAPTFLSGTLGAVAPLVRTSTGVTLASNDGTINWSDPNLEVDLSAATSATINAIRQAFQVQRLLERDARGGTRYTELLLSHFGVTPQDARLQRPEYLGGGSTPVQINPIAQTSASGLSGGSSPLGALGAAGTAVARHGFSGAFTEHGFIIGIVNVRADLTYQQGLHRLWSRQTRYDYYWPAFANLGEQAVLRKEIYFTGLEANDDMVFGYQERWAEYRYHPSMITGKFRSYVSGNIDEWHAAQHFATAPVLGSTFIEDVPPMERILSAGAAAVNMQFLFDSIFTVRATRAMPTYSVPGFIDRF